eukprot:6583797-Alexandrium_andersonii.AAC.1
MDRFAVLPDLPPPIRGRSALSLRRLLPRLACCTFASAARPSMLRPPSLDMALDELIEADRSLKAGPSPQGPGQ